MFNFTLIITLFDAKNLIVHKKMLGTMVSILIFDLNLTQFKFNEFIFWSQ